MNDWPKWKRDVGKNLGVGVPDFLDCAMLRLSKEEQISVLFELELKRIKRRHLKLISVTTATLEPITGETP